MGRRGKQNKEGLPGKGGKENEMPSIGPCDSFTCIILILGIVHNEAAYCT